MITQDLLTKPKRLNLMRSDLWLSKAGVRKGELDKVGQKVHVHTQLCPTLCDPMDYGTPGSSVHAISWARILGWVAISFPRASLQALDWTWVSCISCIGRQILFFFFNFFFILFIYFLFVVDFVIHLNETAMGLHVFPIPIPTPTSLSTRSV